MQNDEHDGFDLHQESHKCTYRRITVVRQVKVEAGAREENAIYIVCVRDTTDGPLVRRRARYDARPVLRSALDGEVQVLRLVVDCLVVIGVGLADSPLDQRK